LSTGGGYFPIVEWPMEVELAGREAVLNTWHRPLHAMTEAFAAAGFRIVSIGEPPVSADIPEDLVQNELGGRRRFVSFVFFALEAAA